MFIIIYELVIAGKRRGFRCEPLALSSWEFADKCAKDTARDRKCRAWVFEAPDPPEVELVDLKAKREAQSGE